MKDPKPERLVVIDGTPIFQRSQPRAQLDSYHTYHSALGRSVAPWLIVTRENTHMTTPHKFLIVQTKDWVVRIQEVRMENDFHTIVMLIVKLHPPYLAQDRVIRVIHHVMRHHRWKGVPFQGINTPF
jgi:hypothetical protein